MEIDVGRLNTDLTCTLRAYVRSLPIAHQGETLQSAMEVIRSVYAKMIFDRHINNTKMWPLDNYDLPPIDEVVLSAFARTCLLDGLYRGTYERHQLDEIWFALNDAVSSVINP